MKNSPLLKPAILVLAGALLGLVFSTALIYEHNGSKTQLGSAVCDQSNTSACERAKESAIGKPFGIPLALFGFFFYGGMAALAVFLLLSLHDLGLRLLFWGAAAALFFDIFLLLYSITVLGGICRLCAVTYVATTLIAVGAYLFKRDGDKMIKPEKISVIAQAAFGILIAATFGLGIFFHNTALSSQTPAANGQSAEEMKLREQLNNEFYKQWKAGEALRLDQPASGSKGAQRPVITVMEFADALCPHCKDMGTVLNEFVKKHPNEVRVIFRHYPLDIQCNDAMKRPFHVGACDLARAMECGESQGKFWAMHDAVFGSQDIFMRNPVTDKGVETLAQGAGVGAGQFMACYRNQSTLGKVKADVAAGNRIKISGTPTVIVNDRRLPGVPLEYIPGILEKILLEESKR